MLRATGETWGNFQKEFCKRLSSRFFENSKIRNFGFKKISLKPKILSKRL